MQKWEYARVCWAAGARWRVDFTHRDAREHIPADQLWPVIRELGEDGWELVNAFPVHGAGEWWVRDDPSPQVGLPGVKPAVASGAKFRVESAVTWYMFKRPFER